MTRRKVKLAFIVNDYARKTTYKKRTKGLLKKVYELSTLCGIEVCAIVYGPYELQPKMWPSPEGVQTVLSKFRELHEFEKSSKMVNQESFMKQRVLKAKEKLKNQRRDNWEKEMTILMSQCLAAGKIVHNNMSMVDLKHLGWLINQNLKEVGRRLEEPDNKDHNQIQIMTTESQISLQMVPPPAFMDDEMAMMGHGHDRMSMNNNAIMQSQFSMDFMTGWLIDQNLKDVGRRLEAPDNKDHSQSQIMTTQSQIPLQMAPPLAFMDDEMAMMGHGHARMSMNNNGILQSQFSMDFMINGNGDEAIPFGEVDPQFLPNLLP